MKRYSIKSCFLMLLILMACDFGDTNTDPTRLQDVDVWNILPAAQAQSARNAGSIGARVTGTVIQHFKGTSLQPESYMNYVLDENIIDDYWRTGLYVGAMKDCNIIIQKSNAQNLPHYRGVAKVLMAYNLALATSLWGDVPYSDAFQGEANLTPLYDTQQEVYATIQRLLDEALFDFARSPGLFAPKADDLVFGGNMARWAATARALKARYYLHLTKVDNDAAVKALTELAMGSIGSNSLQPDFPFENTPNGGNPLAFFAVDRAGQMELGTYLVNLMTSRNDPRLTYYGARSGSVYDISGTGVFWTTYTTPIPLISYAEVEFIRAEAYLRLGDDVKAAESLKKAITANMTRIGLTETAYQNYVNTQGAFSAQQTYEDRLKQIVEQKYIALYGQGTIEAWVDYRRTGYPVLTPTPNAQTSFFSEGVPVIPRRYLYPQSERSANHAHYLEAIERQGGHKLDNDLWAFKSN
ncbi:RagB/SusD family nutrient uptake outer membrane protein [Fulvivirgaceae bacterium PWU4]|uniref:RagB/SusD family nutrient uptake outer membrane protein n=1 Tax=Chryseosolibacter histidini TaxID=2782349 RepID=A0AAP2DR14_9BACT|nr:SusD/RagB family nutrient-binding outer membrane lipoprotein [Chryseosolibacter histidini]MBT1698759.1 RagB/SusD family nutrient uptake outer membrane protein [Chryseosolibacter histidini]